MVFLTELADKGVGYSGINTAKSALSNTLTLADNTNVLIGEHPIVKRFSKEIFNQKLSLPRYSEVWDV